MLCTSILSKAQFRKRAWQLSRVPGGVGPQKNFGEYLAYGTTDKPSFGNYGNIFENMNHPKLNIVDKMAV